MMLLCMLLQTPDTHGVYVQPGTMETPLSIALSNLSEQSTQQLEEKFAIAKLLILSGGELSDGEKMVMLRLLIKQTDQSRVDLGEFLEKTILAALKTLFYSCKMDWRSLLSGLAQDIRNIELIARIVQTPSSILSFLVNEGLVDGQTVGYVLNMFTISKYSSLTESTDR